MWLLPTAAMFAYAGASFLGLFRKRWLQNVFGAVLAAVIIAGGTCMYFQGNYSAADNLFSSLERHMTYEGASYIAAEGQYDADGNPVETGNTERSSWVLDMIEAYDESVSGESAESDAESTKDDASEESTETESTEDDTSEENTETESTDEDSTESENTEDDTSEESTDTESEGGVG